MSTEKFTDVSKKLVRQAEEMSRLLRDANKGMAAAMERAEQLAAAGSFEDAYKLLRGAVNTSYMAPSEAPVVERVVQAERATQPPLAERVENALKNADFPPNFFAGVASSAGTSVKEEVAPTQAAEKPAAVESDFIPVENASQAEEQPAPAEQAVAAGQETSTAFAPKPVAQEGVPVEAVKEPSAPAEDLDANEEAPAIASAPAPGAMFG